MSDRIVMRVGECLVAGGPPGTVAEPEVAIGEMDGPMGVAFGTLLGDQVKGHSRVLAIMNTDIMVRPPTLMVSKVTVNNSRYTNILMGTVQGAIANGVLDAVRAAFEDGASWDLELPHVDPTGQARWIRAIGQRVFDADGSERVIGVFQDITQ